MQAGVKTGEPKGTGDKTRQEAYAVGPAGEIDKSVPHERVWCLVRGSNNEEDGNHDKDGYVESD